MRGSIARFTAHATGGCLGVTWYSSAVFTLCWECLPAQEFRAFARSVCNSSQTTFRLSAGFGWEDGIFLRTNCAIIPKMELEDAIRFPGYVPDHDLVAFYQKAAAYVFPSLSEGFGLPPLEAMLYGTPVVSSNATCLPEILQTPRSMWILTIRGYGRWHPSPFIR